MAVRQANYSSSDYWRTKVGADVVEGEFKVVEEKALPAPDLKPKKPDRKAWPYAK